MCMSSSGAWQLQGVLSKHGECGGSSARPAIFTAVHELKEWIENTVGKFTSTNIHLKIICILKDIGVFQ